MFETATPAESEELCSALRPQTVRPRAQHALSRCQSRQLRIIYWEIENVQVKGKLRRPQTCRAQRQSSDVSGLYGNHIDLDFEPRAPRRQDHALDWGDVGIVPSPGDDDVVVLDRCCVGRVEVSPTERRAAPQRHPGMRSVCAREAFFAGRRNGSDVAADIKRRQANAAHCGDHDMGEILAYAASTIEGFGRGRIDLSRFRIIDEVGTNAPSQLDRRVKNRTARREALFGVGRGLVKQRNATRRIERDCGAVGSERGHRDRLARRRSPKRGFAVGAGARLTRTRDDAAI